MLRVRVGYLTNDCNLFISFVDMLTAFSDDSGGFKAANPKDIDAFVALHEASYLAFPGEAMLDDARSILLLVCHFTAEN